MSIDEAFAKILLEPENARKWADTLQSEIKKLDSRSYLENRGV